MGGLAWFTNGSSVLAKMLMQVHDSCSGNLYHGFKFGGQPSPHESKPLFDRRGGFQHYALNSASHFICRTKDKGGGWL